MSLENKEYLETTECISINNNGKVYTDCMEFSLLRFIQLMHYNPKELVSTGYSNYENTIDCEDSLLNFMKKYPLIYSKADYYLTDNSLGVLQRGEWATLVSDNDFLDYYRNDKAELFTSVQNIIKFFNEFYNMNLDIGNHQESLNSIAKYFTTDNKKITIQLANVDITNLKMKMSNIWNYISRPEPNYKYNDETIYDVNLSKSTINITINNKYKWSLMEMYITNSNVYINNYITGHSVIYM